MRWSSEVGSRCEYWPRAFAVNLLCLRHPDTRACLGHPGRTKLRVPRTRSQRGPCGREKLDRPFRLAIEDQLAQDFAQHAGEFEAVAREPGGERDLRMFGIDRKSVV